MSVREAQEKISEEEFRYWLAYNKISPIGDERQDMLHGILCSLLANINRQKGQAAYNFKDFLPDWRPKQINTEESIFEALKGLNIGNLRRT